MDALVCKLYLVPLLPLCAVLVQVVSADAGLGPDLCGGAPSSLGVGVAVERGVRQAVGLQELFKMSW